VVRLAALGVATAVLAAPALATAQATATATAGPAGAGAGAEGPPTAPDPARTGIGFSPLSFVYTAIQAGIGVSRHAEMEQTNELLRARGLDELPDLLTTVSLALTAAYPMGLVVEPLYRFNIVGTDQTTLTMHQLLLDVGWLIYAKDDVVAYPFIGMGYGNSSMDISAEPPQQSFYDLLGAPEGEALLSNSSLVLQAGLAASLWGSGHGDFLGLRFGAFWAPISSGWKRRGKEVFGGPDPPMSGFYLTGTLGYHDPRWR
jgi:hypothetical protein